MRKDLITFRSVTLAQRGQRMLRQAGIACTLQRTPRKLQDRGCGYCLQLHSGDTMKAMELLKNSGIPFSQVYTGGAEAVL